MGSGDASQRSVDTEPFDYHNETECNETLEGDSRSEPTIGEFSLAPTTQTTIVTTTTTTTTKFPPLVMRAPRPLRTLDPKRYPLAAAPTPDSLKDIKFNINGKPLVFNEADDGAKALAEVREIVELFDL